MFASSAADPQTIALYSRVLAGDLGLAQLWFDHHVLDEYRARAGWRVFRTDSAGRLKSPEGWSLDFGIADADRLIHAPAADIAQRLPSTERQHWARHLVTPPMSRNFVTMRLSPGSCVGDGDLRDWAG